MEEKKYDIKQLAYLGDAVYEVYIREHLVLNSKDTTNILHQRSTKYVSAKAQAHIYQNIENLLTEEEKNIVRRGRNAQANTIPKNTDIIIYKIATGFEALMGYVYLYSDNDRLKYLINKSIEIIEG